MKLGDWVKVPDGRVGTVVYNGLDGVGIKWGEHELTQEDRQQINGLCPLFAQPIPVGYSWKADAMLRNKSLTKLLKMECVGEESTCEIVAKQESEGRK